MTLGERQRDTACVTLKTGRGHQPRNPAASGSSEGKKTESPLEPPEGTRASVTVILVPGEPFQASDLQSDKIIHCIVFSH